MPTQQQVRSRRGRNAQAASAQQLKTENVTAEQSVTLMKNLFRTSISTICYLRDLFPEDCFKEKRLTDITIQTLDPKCDNAEATLLIEWLEKVRNLLITFHLLLVVILTYLIIIM